MYKKNHWFAVVYAERTFLPLRRRLAITRRPFFVLIRLRKPWTFECLRLLGWYVLFILFTSKKDLLSILFDIPWYYNESSMILSIKKWIKSFTSVFLTPSSYPQKLIFIEKWSVNWLNKKNVVFKFKQRFSTHSQAKISYAQPYFFLCITSSKRD